MEACGEKIIELLLGRIDTQHNEVKDMMDELDTLSQRVQSYQQAIDWSLLGKRRLLASNSLTDVSSSNLSHRLKQWDQANLYVHQALLNDSVLNVDHICKLNTLLISGGGSLRDSEIYGAGSQYLSLAFLQKGLDLFSNKVLKTDREAPLVKAFDVYLWIINLHPFNDGNGRTARLASDWILLQNNILPLGFNSSIAAHVRIDESHDLSIKTKYFIRFLQGITRSYDLIDIKSPG